MIDAKDVMRRYTVEQLNETADAYFRRVSDPTPLMSKPFTFLHEAPEALQNLGLLLSGLHLGKTMTVLDFGAGTCWLSRFLAQLNCRPVCCDVSEAALAIGKRLFNEHPVMGTTVYRPTFLVFDGHRIDLPDESVDRIVSFDAFHHVPNPGEVIRELSRVLRRGGIAGFSEPGRQHSRTPQSQYEMQNHRVLENDINLNEIFRDAKPAGFTELTVKVLTDMEISLDEYNVMYEADGKEPLKSRTWNQTYNTMFNRSIFFLHKGPLRRDSRSHIGLAHSIAVDRGDVVTTSGIPVGLTFTLHNAGGAAWLDRNSEIFGIVRLASHLYDNQGNLIEVDYSRHDLPAPVEPGETIRLTIDVSLPGPGGYELAFDLVSEGVMWFENQGSKPIRVKVRVLP